MMTDNEIIKALDYCTQQGITSECERCEVKKGCRSELIVNALDIITRQKAEIKRLTTLAELGNVRANDYREMRDKLKKANAEIERLQGELETTRAYLHDNGLEWDLLSYSKRNGG
jgi:hypothetical protein